MAEAFDLIQAGRERQRLRDEAIHGWYQFVLAYPDHLITEMLDRFQTPSCIVLDPFCGSGTTLVECKKLGIDSVGIDANPAPVLASRVKVRWDLDPQTIEDLAQQAIAAVAPVASALLLSDMPLFGANGDLAALRSAIVRESAEAQYHVTSVPDGEGLHAQHAAGAGLPGVRPRSRQPAVDQGPHAPEPQQGDLQGRL